MKEELNREAEKPVMKEKTAPAEQSPAMEAAQNQATDEKQKLSGKQGSSGTGLDLDDFIPSVQKNNADQSKTEGGIMLDVIISNLYATFQQQMQKRVAAQKAAQERNTLDNNGDKPRITPEEFKCLMEKLQKEGVNLEQLHKNGDMDRLLQGRITKEVYSRTPEGSWIEREGPLFIGSDKQIHQTLIKRENVLEKDLTAKQNARLQKEGEVLKGDTLIRRNPKTRRVQRIPASQAARQRHKKQISKKVQQNRQHKPRQKTMKRGL